MTTLAYLEAVGTARLIAVRRGRPELLVLVPTLGVLLLWAMRSGVIDTLRELPPEEGLNAASRLSLAVALLVAAIMTTMTTVVAAPLAPIAHRLDPRSFLAARLLLAFLTALAADTLVTSAVTAGIPVAAGAWLTAQVASGSLGAALGLALAVAVEIPVRAAVRSRAAIPVSRLVTILAALATLAYVVTGAPAYPVLVLCAAAALALGIRVGTEPVRPEWLPGGRARTHRAGWARVTIGEYTYPLVLIARDLTCVPLALALAVGIAALGATMRVPALAEGLGGLFSMAWPTLTAITVATPAVVLVPKIVRAGAGLYPHVQRPGEAAALGVVHGALSAAGLSVVSSLCVNLAQGTTPLATEVLRFATVCAVIGVLGATLGAVGRAPASAADLSLGLSLLFTGAAGLAVAWLSGLAALQLYAVLLGALLVGTGVVRTALVTRKPFTS